MISITQTAFPSMTHKMGSVEKAFKKVNGGFGVNILLLLALYKNDLYDAACESACTREKSCECQNSSYLHLLLLTVGK